MSSSAGGANGSASHAARSRAIIAGIARLRIMFGLLT
jgi:hypothetical protein